MPNELTPAQIKAELTDEENRFRESIDSQVNWQLMSEGDACNIKKIFTSYARARIENRAIKEFLIFILRCLKARTLVLHTGSSAIAMIDKIIDLLGEKKEEAK